MRKIYLLICSTIYFSLLQLSVIAQCGTNILNNPGFDAPIQPLIGNNLTGLFTFNGGWTMTGSPINIIRTNGSTYSGGPDNAQNGSQYVDITNGTGTIYQDFTISGASTPVAFGGYFSSREQSVGYLNWTASINIVSLPSLTVVASSNSRLFTNEDGALPSQETWHYINGNTTLPTGNYRYVVNLGDYGNFDASFVYLNCTLPIKLKYFSGTYQNNSTGLNWEIENQSNFSYFEIERSLDGRNFNPLVNIPFTKSSSYNYSDLNISSNTNYYYRLKMVDIDGKFSYSNIIIVQTKGSVNFSILENPVSDNLNIKGLNSNGEINIFDVAGKLLVKRNIKSQSLSIDVSFLNNGIYFLQYSDGNNTETKKFIKQ